MAERQKETKAPHRQAVVRFALDVVRRFQPCAQRKVRTVLLRSAMNAAKRRVDV